MGRGASGVVLSANEEAGRVIGLAEAASSNGSYPPAELSSSPLALIIVFATAKTALVQAAILGVFDVPLVLNVQLA